MVTYNSKEHSFSYDNEFSSEMPSIEEVRKDKYGAIVDRMAKHCNMVFSVQKWRNMYHFSIRRQSRSNDENYYAYNYDVSVCSLKDLFKKFTSLDWTPFYGKSYDEVLVMLDLLEVNSGDV